MKVNDGEGILPTYLCIIWLQLLSFDDAPERLVKGTPRHPVPIILLARLAVDQDWQGKGLGAALVVNAIRRVLQASEIVGVRVSCR